MTKHILLQSFPYPQVNPRHTVSEKLRNILCNICSMESIHAIGIALFPLFSAAHILKLDYYHNV